MSTEKPKAQSGFHPQAFLPQRDCKEAAILRCEEFNRRIPVGTLVDCWKLPEWTPHFHAKPARGVVFSPSTVIENRQPFEVLSADQIGRFPTAAVTVQMRNGSLEVIPIRHVIKA